MFCCRRSKGEAARERDAGPSNVIKKDEGGARALVEEGETEEVEKGDVRTDVFDVGDFPVESESLFVVTTVVVP